MIMMGLNLQFLKNLRKNQLSENSLDLHCYVLGNNMGTYSAIKSRICESMSGFLLRILDRTGRKRTIPLWAAQEKQPTIVDLCTLLSSWGALSVKSGHG